MKLSEGSRRKPKEAKDALPSGGSRRTCFFQNKFRKPKDALFSKQVRILRLPSESRHPARGEAFRRKPKDAKDALPSGGSRRTRFFQNKLNLWRFLREGRPPELLSERASSRRKDVLLSFFQKGRPPARGEAFRRTPKEAEGRKQVASFGNLWRFLREGRPPELLSERASSRRKGVLRFLRKAPEVKLPEGSRQR